MIAMDRVNLFARGWSHVVSTAHDIDELDAFRIRVGAPAPALQLSNPRWPHLDLRDGVMPMRMLADAVVIEQPVTVAEVDALGD